ncbi:MAG: branched-chain amino acid ABC transporter permease [Clostridia bacterium]|nr:branched-chain amino acid ABC transporter permease [Clostridia bacterium]
MKFLSKIKWNHYINYIVIGIFTAVYAVMTFSGMRIEGSVQALLEKIAISIILSVSLSLVVGFLGELSLGHAGFMCMGAYLGGKVASLLEPTFGNGPVIFIIGLVVGGVVAAICGVIIGLPALRLRGDYLAIVTLAFGEIVKSIFQNTSTETFGGAIGLSTPRYDKKTLFIWSFVLVLITLAVVQNLIRSKHGRAITAIRDNEIAARASGINVTKYKLIAFTVSAFFAGIAGVLYSFSNYTIQSSKFGYNYSIEILVMVVLGGMGSINGSIIAAALITFLNTKLATVLTGDLAVLQNFLYALVLIAVVIYNNAPALRSFRNKYNFGALINKFKKHDPADRRDDKAKWDVVPTKIEMNEVLSVDMKPQQSQNGDKEEK